MTVKKAYLHNVEILYVQYEGLLPISLVCKNTLEIYAKVILSLKLHKVIFLNHNEDLLVDKNSAFIEMFL